jgi:hypothetical protein
VSEATHDLVVPTWADLAPVGLADDAGATRVTRLKTIPGGERPALQSVRRSISYVIASAATCAPLGAA